MNDIAHHLPEGFVSGAVYLNALPYIGPPLQTLLSPEIQLLVGNIVSDDIEVIFPAIETFIHSIFINSKTIPWSTIFSWLGMVALQPPKLRRLILTRPQDPEKLLQLGREGFPVLVVSGVHDQFIIGDRLVEEMKRTSLMCMFV